MVKSENGVFPLSDCYIILTRVVFFQFTKRPKKFTVLEDAFNNRDVLEFGNIIILCEVNIEKTRDRISEPSGQEVAQNINHNHTTDSFLPRSE